MVYTLIELKRHQYILKSSDGGYVMTTRPDQWEHEHLRGYQNWYVNNMSYEKLAKEYPDLYVICERVTWKEMVQMLELYELLGE